MPEQAPDSPSVRITETTESVTSSHDSSHGRKRTDYFREYKRQAAAERRAYAEAGVERPRFCTASGPDYVRIAEEILAPGQHPTREQEREAVQMAKAFLLELGIWPEHDKKKKRAA